MKLLGIDFGTKNVGVALSDEEENLAFPHAVLINDTALVDSIKEIIQNENVSEVIIGESRDLDGSENRLMKNINEFKKILEEETTLPIHLEPEFMTTAQAVRFQGNTPQKDASAAAIILQSYIDTYKKTQ